MEHEPQGARSGLDAHDGIDTLARDPARIRQHPERQERGPAVIAHTHALTVACLHGAIVVAVLGPLVALAERAVPEVEGTSPLRRGANSSAWGFIALWLALVPLAGAGLGAIAAMLSTHGLLRGWADQWPGWARAGAAGVVAETTAYWVHRAEHARGPLWRIHATHHGSAVVDWRTSFRFHPVDVLTLQGAPVVVAAAMGFGPVDLVPYLGVFLVVTFLAHADVWVPGPWLDRLVVTPAYHRTHHELHAMACNLAPVLPVVDMLFRTARFDRGPRRFGVPVEVPGSAVAQLLWPIRARSGAVSGTPAPLSQEQ